MLAGLRISQRRHHDYDRFRRARIRAQASAHFVAIQSRHLHIQQHELGPVCAHLGKAGGSIARFDDLVRRAVKQPEHRAALGRIVVNDHDNWPGGGCRTVNPGRLL